MNHCKCDIEICVEVFGALDDIPAGEFRRRSPWKIVPLRYFHIFPF